MEKKINKIFISTRLCSSIDLAPAAALESPFATYLIIKIIFRSLSYCKTLYSFAIVSLLVMLIKTKQEMIQQIQQINILLIGFVKSKTKQSFLTKK